MFGFIKKKCNILKKIIPFRWFYNDEEYPLHILPSEDKKIINSNVDDCVIFRHFQEIPNFPVIDPNTNYINQRYLIHPSSNIIDLSTNLFGLFTHKEGEIKIIGDNLKYFNQYCKPNIKAKIPVHKKDYIHEERQFWHVLIGDIQKIIVDYPSPNKNSTAFTAKCCVLHTPMKWNYWHYSVRWRIFQEEQEFYLDQIDEKKQRRYIKKIASETRSVLIKNISLKLENLKYRTIEKNEFLDNL